MSLITRKNGDKCNPRRLAFFLKLDKWNLNEAVSIFNNIDPKGGLPRPFRDDSIILESIDLESFELDRYLLYIKGHQGKTLEKPVNAVDILLEQEELFDLLDDQNYEVSPEFKYDTPRNWIKKAIKKGISISWLEFAIEEGFFDESAHNLNALSKGNLFNVFDMKSLVYPPELDLALKAWQAVSTCEGKGKPKARIRTWLDSNTNLSNEAKERISIVANWDKSGGATRTE